MNDVELKEYDLLAMADIDHTTLKTSEFSRALAHAVHALRPDIDPQIFYDEIQMFYSKRPNDPSKQLGYDLPAHLAYHGIDFVEHREDLLDLLSKVNLVYDDAVNAIARLHRNAHAHLVFLTLGDRATQLFKISIIEREVARRFAWNEELQFDCEVLEVEKGFYLTNLLSGIICYGNRIFKKLRFADDNDTQFIGLDIEDLDPKTVEICQLQRLGAKYPLTTLKGVIPIGSLAILAR